MNKHGGVPNHVDYRRYATQERAIEGTIPLVSLPRVTAEASRAPSADAVAQLQLAFAEDSQRWVRVTGRITAQLVLNCQRCARPFEQAIDAAVAGIVVADDDAAAAVPRDDEPVMADGDKLNVLLLAEDELLLALPMVARCNNPDCRARFETDASVSKAQPPKRKDNPFAVLKNLKHDDETD